MGLLGTIIGGVGGFFLGGPAGALAGAQLGGGIDAARDQRNAARNASGAQIDAAGRAITGLRGASQNAYDTIQGATDLSVEEQRTRLDAVRKLLNPYVRAGTGALGGQMDLLGLSGGDQQAAAIAALQGSPQFAAITQQGENAILQNASATGGLRGGNTQGALAQFRPELLSRLIEQQFGRLGGISGMGLNASQLAGNAEMSAGGLISQLIAQGGANQAGSINQSAINQANLMTGQGAAQAGAALANGRAGAGLAGAATGALGMFYGLGGFNGINAANPYTTPGAGGGYANPTGSGYDYRGAMLPGLLRGGF